MLKNKKIYIYSILVLLLIVLAWGGVMVFDNVKYNFMDSKDVVAEIGEEKIRKKDVENRILAIKINAEATKLATYESHDEDTANSIIQKIKDQPTFKEELNNMIESAKIREYLKKIKNEVSYAEAIEFTNKNIFNSSTTATTRKFEPELLKKAGITEEVYKKGIYSYYYDLLCNTRLFEYFNKNLYDVNSKNSLQNQFKEFLSTILS